LHLVVAARGATRAVFEHHRRVHGVAPPACPLGDGWHERALSANTPCDCSSARPCRPCHARAERRVDAALPSASTTQK
jgi:hypothetical protein